MGRKQSDKYLLEHNGQTIECDRVTAILGATKASAGLAYWYGKEERKGCQGLASRGDVDKLLALPLTEETLFASQLRDAAADSGTGIHALIHCDATGERLPEDIVLTEDDWRRYKLWEDFKQKEGITYVDSELRVYSPELMVAGTMDLAVNWKGQLWGWDTKTGALKRDAATQMVTYWLLRAETLAIKNGDVVELQKMERDFASGIVPTISWAPLGVLHIDDDKVEIYEIDPKEVVRLARNFLYRLQIFRDDQVLRPFRRLYPPPRLLKSGEYQDVKWLRAS